MSAFALDPELAGLAAEEAEAALASLLLEATPEGAADGPALETPPERADAGREDATAVAGSAAW